MRGKFLWISALALLTTVPAVAYDRQVLCEEFTSVTCGYCSIAGQALEMMLDNYQGQVPPGTFTLLQIHVGDGYSTTWGTNRANSFYGFQGTPTAWFDGLLERVGAMSTVMQQFNWYLSTYQTRRNVSSPLTITSTGEGSGSTYTIRANIFADPNAATRPLRLYMAQVLDNWPSSPTYSRYGFKQASTTQDVTIAPGGSYLFERTFTFDSYSMSHSADIKIVIWAQAPVNHDPAEVYQAYTMHWPFPTDCNDNGIPDAQEPDCDANGVPDECDIAGGAPDCDLNGVPDSCDIAGGAADCNANSVPDSCDIAGGTSQDANGNGIPDECEQEPLLPGDMDCSTVVDFGDINPFVLALTNPTAWDELYDCDIMNGDVNGNGEFGFDDINPFVSLLTGG